MYLGGGKVLYFGPDSANKPQLRNFLFRPDADEVSALVVAAARLQGRSSLHCSGRA